MIMQFAWFIWKDAKRSYFIAKELNIFGGVFYAHSKQEKEPLIDLRDLISVHFNSGGTDSLQYNSHVNAPIALLK